MLDAMPNLRKILGVCASVSILYFAFLTHALAQDARSPAGTAIALSVDRTAQGFGMRIEYLEDQTGQLDLDQARAAFERRAYTQIETSEVNFGLSNATHWLTFMVASDAQSQQDWVINLGKPYLQSADLFVDRAGSITQILEDGHNTRFADRTNPNRMLVSKPFQLSPGEHARIWVRYAADASSNLPLRIQTPELFQAAAAQAEVQLAIYYAIGAMIALFSLATAVVLRARLILFYALFFTFLLAFNAQINGTLFQVLWPNAPELNAIIAHPFSQLSMAFAALFGREFVLEGTRYSRALGHISLGLAAAAGLCAVLPVALDFLTARKIGALVALAVIGLQLINASVAFAYRRSGSGYFLAGSVLLVLYVGAFAVTQVFLPSAQSGVYDLFRYGQLIDGAIFAAAAFRRTYLLRKHAEKSAERAAFASQELMYTRHDLRQPLASLSTTLAEMTRSGTPADEQLVRKLSQSVDYLHGVLSENSMRFEAEDKEPQTISNVVDSAVYMFADDARQKGIRLTRDGDSDLPVEDPIALLRVVSNLLSNAVEHSEAKNISASIMKAGHGAQIRVSDDGVGLPERAISQIMSHMPDSKGEPSARGHGLNIIRQIADENGWRIHAQSSAAVGAKITISNVG